MPKVGDLQRMLTGLDGTRYRIPFLLIQGTAMRRGEVVGLKWEDFRADTCTLIIQRAMVQVKGRVIEKKPKNNKTRVVLLPNYLVEELEAHREYQHSMGWITDWIVTNNKGEHMTPYALSSAIRDIRKSANVTASMHEWRHNQATMLLLKGVPVKVVSERLGHSNINITQDVYAHVLPQMQKVAADILDDIWSAEIGVEKGNKTG